MMLTYYSLHREERLAYQKQYNNSEYYKAYQQDYYDKNKDYFKEKNKKYNLTHKKEKVRKPLPQYKLDAIQRILRKKLKEYNKSLLQENVKPTCTPPVISESPIKDVVVKPFEGFTVRNNMFVLSFN